MTRVFVFVGHAALFIAAVILITIYVMSKRNPAPKTTIKEDENDDA